jgi:hypothetical protein
MTENPMHPHEYARRYRAWEMDNSIVEQILTCCCGACAICCIIRPFALQAKFPDEVKEVEEYPEDEYTEEE